MVLAFEKPLIELTEERTHDSMPEVYAVFTGIETAVAALKRAGDLARPLGARVTLVVPQTVGFPAPLESPPVLLDFNERRFHQVARESNVETTVRIYLCRDRWELLVRVLRPHSRVVLGGRRRWWPTTETRLARRLRSIGHEVEVIKAE